MRLLPLLITTFAVTTSCTHPPQLGETRFSVDGQYALIANLCLMERDSTPGWSLYRSGSDTTLLELISSDKSDPNVLIDRLTKNYHQLDSLVSALELTVPGHIVNDQITFHSWQEKCQDIVLSKLSNPCTGYKTNYPFTVCQLNVAYQLDSSTFVTFTEDSTMKGQYCEKWIREDFGLHFKIPHPVYTEDGIYKGCTGVQIAFLGDNGAIFLQAQYPICRPNPPHVFPLSEHECDPLPNVWERSQSGGSYREKLWVGPTSVD